MIKIAMYSFVLKLVSSLSGAKGGRSCGGGKGRGFCFLSPVCMCVEEKKIKKNDLKKRFLLRSEYAIKVKISK